jgi:micrococcal nuclease
MKLTSSTANLNALRIRLEAGLRPLRVALTAGFAIILLTSPVSAMDFCSGKVRVTCVVDGDTFWLDGEKIRLADIDAPESGGACQIEREIAAKASGRLAELLSSGTISIERQGVDHYKRTLGVVSVDGVKVAEVLIREGIARPWRGRKEQWCN